MGFLKYILLLGIPHDVSREKFGITFGFNNLHLTRLFGPIVVFARLDFLRGVSVKMKMYTPNELFIVWSPLGYLVVFGVYIYRKKDKKNIYLQFSVTKQQ